MSGLIVSAITPALTSGTGLRTYGVTAALARHHAIEIAYVPWGAREPAAEYEQLAGVALRELGASRGARRAIAFARARALGVPRDLARGVSPALAVAARSAPPDTWVIADGPVVAAALKPLARRRRVTYLAHNLESGGFRRESERAVLERFERDILRTFSESWMATRADEQGAKRLAGPGVVTRYVPNVVDTDRIVPIVPIVPSGRERLLFVADFSYEPNREALSFLTDSVLPALWKRRPTVRLAALGAGLPEAPADPRIEAPGFVDDLPGEYGNTDIVLVPLRRGGGSPLKFIEGLAYGLPVVATDHAARLLEDGVAGRDFLAADSGEQFAAAIELLLSDPDRAAAIGAAGRELAVRRYSVPTLATLLACPPPAAET
jgi:glycosyltransferase involved in cell wall biosynthesis